MEDRLDADAFLVHNVRAGSARAWDQLVQRYQGRLLAFARGRGAARSDAEDFVQDAFLDFVRFLPRFDERASLETFLFMILRRKIIDHFRSSGVHHRAAASLDEAQSPARPDDVSRDAGHDEQREACRAALASAISRLVGRMKEGLQFRDLMIVESLFRAQIRNKQIAQLVGIDEGVVGQVKHRWIKQVRDDVAQGDRRVIEMAADENVLESLLTQVWDDIRPACPKRSTVGGFVLGTLDPPWQSYV
ncbi:MAG TPA: sigma-70 family RNA polymerase sigma factor, partial [Verrucomicrobiaceae bacterium]